MSTLLNSFFTGLLGNNEALYEFPLLKVPVLLLIGQLGNTALGKDAASPELQKQLGNYKKLRPEVAAQIPDATLVAFPDLGHSPQIQAPERFHKALVRGLSRPSSK